MKARHSSLLIVDDEANDRLLLEQAFEQLGAYQIIALSNGEEAIALIKGAGKYGDRTEFHFPSCIVTDLKMSPGDGFALLNFIKRNPALSIIPVVMLSGSSDPDDIRHAYVLGASSFFIKPTAFADLKALAASINQYWAKCEVPAVDLDGYAVMTDSAGKAGEIYPLPAKRPATIRPFTPTRREASPPRTT